MLSKLRKFLRNTLASNASGRVPMTLYMLFGEEFIRMGDRTHLVDRRNSVRGCLPGSRLALYPNGTFHTCERIDPDFPIGNVENGIDIRKVNKLISDYHDQVILPERCQSCAVLHLCNVCYASCGEDGRFKAGKICTRMKRNLGDFLAFWYSILEKNPRAVDEVRLPSVKSTSILDKAL